MTVVAWVAIGISAFSFFGVFLRLGEISRIREDVDRMLNSPRFTGEKDVEPPPRGGSGQAWGHSVPTSDEAPRGLLDGSEITFESDPDSGNMLDSDPLAGFVNDMKPHKARYEEQKQQATPRPRKYLTRGDDNAPVYTTDANGTEVRDYDRRPHQFGERPADPLPNLSDDGKSGYRTDRPLLVETLGREMDPTNSVETTFVQYRRLEDGKGNVLRHYSLEPCDTYVIDTEFPQCRRCGRDHRYHSNVPAHLCPKHITGHCPVCGDR
jgi:hypothetical protein